MDTFVRKLYQTSNDIPLAVTITVMFANTVVELCPLAAAAAVAELVKPERSLEVGVLLRPANPGGGPVRHLHDLDLVVPVAARHSVRGARRAVELGARDVHPVVRHVQLRRAVVQRHGAALGGEHAAEEAGDGLARHVRALVELLSVGRVGVRLGQDVAVAVPVEGVLLGIPIRWQGRRGQLSARLLPCGPIVVQLPLSATPPSLFQVSHFVCK